MKRWPIALTAVTVMFAAAVMLAGAAWAGPAGAAGIVSTDSTLTAKRDPRWAVAIEKPGLPNFFKVSDDLYRGAQPTGEGLRGLVALGVKTDVNLRSFHSDGELLEGVPLAYEHIYVKAWHAEDEDIVAFLKIVTDTSKTPVFVHCQHGSDRTGMMVAIYRIVVQGWTKDDAIKEMTEGGYGFHPIWKDLVEHIRELDVEKLKAKAKAGE